MAIGAEFTALRGDNKTAYQVTIDKPNAARLIAKIGRMEPTLTDDQKKAMELVGLFGDVGNAPATSYVQLARNDAAFSQRLLGGAFTAAHARTKAAGTAQDIVAIAPSIGISGVTEEIAAEALAGADITVSPYVGAFESLFSGGTAALSSNEATQLKAAGNEAAVKAAKDVAKPVVEAAQTAGKAVADAAKEGAKAAGKGAAGILVILAGLGYAVFKYGIPYAKKQGWIK